MVFRLSGHLCTLGEQLTGISVPHHSLDCLYSHFRFQQTRALPEHALTPPPNLTAMKIQHWKALLLLLSRPSPNTEQFHGTSRQHDVRCSHPPDQHKPHDVLSSPEPHFCECPQQVAHTLASHLGHLQHALPRNLRLTIRIRIRIRIRSKQCTKRQKKREDWRVGRRERVRGRGPGGNKRASRKLCQPASKDHANGRGAWKPRSAPHLVLVVHLHANADSAGKSGSNWGRRQRQAGGKQGNISWQDTKHDKQTTAPVPRAPLAHLRWSPG